MEMCYYHSAGERYENKFNVKKGPFEPFSHGFIIICGFTIINGFMS